MPKKDRRKHCNADNFKTLKTNYMLKRLNMSVFQAIAEKTAKKSQGNIFAAPCKTMPICR